MCAFPNNVRSRHKRYSQILRRNHSNIFHRDRALMHIIPPSLRASLRIWYRPVTQSGIPQSSSSFTRMSSKHSPHFDVLRSFSKQQDEPRLDVMPSTFIELIESIQGRRLLHAFKRGAFNENAVALPRVKHRKGNQSGFILSRAKLVFLSILRSSCANREGREIVLSDAKLVSTRFSC